MSPAVPERRLPPSPAVCTETTGRAAFDAIVDALWEPILHFFWRGVSLHDAEELAQRTFARAYRATRAGGGPAAADLPGWRRYLFTCARHVGSTTRAGTGRCCRSRTTCRRASRWR